ncbi:CLUMA_CG015923, isoform A [Clunio marinus]|uniref:CLUMA_CG015923, isoform A n=1 Tax=Clunio marinus TaxID=568069 RepID=A0A1J1IT83_9DIPT|nr:CLUMA_CG015923, isoform A [Clunio marinus]
MDEKAVELLLLCRVPVISDDAKWRLNLILSSWHCLKENIANKNIQMEHKTLPLLTVKNWATFHVTTLIVKQPFQFEIYEEKEFNFSPLFNH